MGAHYSAGTQTRDALFRRFLLASHRREDARPIDIDSPYWGDLGARLRWDGASLPLADIEALGSAETALADLHASALPEESVESENRAVLQVAKRSLPDAVDLLWGASALTESGAFAEATALAALAAPVLAYAQANPHPAWLADVDDDQQFVNRLRDEVEAYVPPGRAGEAQRPPEWESLGIDTAWNAVRRGVARLRSAVVGTVGRAASDRIRPAVVPSIATFLGDIFVYLHQQNNAVGPIRALVATAIREAAQRTEPDDPLIVVAHSMGGNITYDLLTEELADVSVPLLVTAGTQVGFFEELKLFRSSDPAIPHPGVKEKVARPSNVERWVNIFDYSDVLGFLVGTVIDGVDDFTYRTGSLLKAHSQYFVQPSFHQRLAARVVGGP
jgi:hypothetical protein